MSEHLRQVGPARCESLHLGPLSVKQRVVDGDETYHVARQKKAHHQASYDSRHLLDLPAGVREDPVRPLVAPGL